MDENLKMAMAALTGVDPQDVVSITPTAYRVIVNDKDDVSSNYNGGHRYYYVEVS
jgi:hypothetical protein